MNVIPRSIKTLTELYNRFDAEVGQRLYWQIGGLKKTRIINSCHVLMTSYFIKFSHHIRSESTNLFDRQSEFLRICL